MLVLRGRAGEPDPGREAGQSSPELLLLRLKGCPAACRNRDEELPCQGQPGLEEADWSKLLLDTD